MEGEPIRPMPKPTPVPKQPRRGIPRVNLERRQRKRDDRKERPERYCAFPGTRCIKKVARWGWCHSHSLEYMDRLWASKVKAAGPYCALAAIHAKYGYPECVGPLNACHGVNRDYMWTRWDLRNGAPGCGGFNKWSEFHTLEAEAIWREFLTDAVYDELRATAVSGARGLNGDVDWDEWRARLEAAA